MYLIIDRWYVLVPFVLAPTAHPYSVKGTVLWPELLTNLLEDGRLGMT